jgi:hypothetical protein
MGCHVSVTASNHNRFTPHRQGQLRRFHDLDARPHRPNTTALQGSVRARFRQQRHGSPRLPHKTSRGAEDYIAAVLLPQPPPTRSHKTVRKPKRSSGFRVGRQARKCLRRDQPHEPETGFGAHGITRRPLGPAPPTAARAGPTDDGGFGSTRMTGLTPCVATPSCARGRNALRMRGRSSAPKRRP